MADAGVKVMDMIKKTWIRLISIAAFAAVLTGTAGCGRKAEAVITPDGEDITETATEYETLSVSTAKTFSYDDLKVGKVEYLMTEEQVKAVLGNPITMYDSTEKASAAGDIAERVYSYNELTLIFSEMEGQYLLTAAASVGDKDIFSRGLKVGDSVQDILAVYYRDANCYNNTYYSADKTTKLGKYLYGSYTMESLDTIKTGRKVEYGIINFNGYASMETAASYIIEMTYFEPPYKNTTASLSDDFAQIAFDIDDQGKITAIRWYYYPEEA